LNPLYLSGFGVSLNVDAARLMVKDGFLEPDSEQTTYEFEPRRIPYDSIVIDGHTGTVSLTAMKWLMRHETPLFILDYNGTLLSSTLPREPVNGPLKIAQVEAYKDAARRFYIAKKLVEAKAQCTLSVMKWLAARYGELSSQVHSDLTSEFQRLEQCQNLPRLLMVEGRIADIYWRYLQRILPNKLGFTSRMHETRQMNASDPFNALLNYGYAILESQCRKALNSVGLEPTIGFLHEARQTKYPLVYDLQEPYRWLVDTAVVSYLGSRYRREDFYRMDNYVLRLRPEAVRKLIDALRVKFNSPVRHAGRLYSWDTIVRLKAQELANHILRRRRVALDFGEPKPALERADSQAVRDQILSLTTTEARKLGVRRNTLWYLQERAKTEKSFRVYSKVRTKLSQANS